MSYLTSTYSSHRFLLHGEVLFPWEPFMFTCTLMHLHPLELTQIQAHLTKTLKPNLLNSILRSLTLTQSPIKSLQIYNQMVQASPSSQDHFTYTCILKACSLLHSFAGPKGFEVHARALKSGHGADLFVQNSLISFYSSAGDAVAARRVFAGISRPDVVSWTSVVSALARNGCEREALLAFASMDCRPNAMTLASVLPACSCIGALELGRSVHGFCVRGSRCGGRNVILDNALLDMCMSCGDLCSARRLFGEMPERDVVSWTTMVSGYVRNGSSEEAMSVFCEMVMDGEAVPNEATLVSVLGACASLAALSFGKWVHSYSMKSGPGIDGVVGNALINMYAKCGEVGMALRVFDGLLCKDLVSWCTVIWGMAMNGQGNQALKLFGLMLCHGVQPNGVVFLAVLSACCHAGLVDQGALIFKAMIQVYGVVPEKEHFTCMIDAYGRTGRLKEAEDFVRGMPFEPDGHTFGALLSACKMYERDEAVRQCLWRWASEYKSHAGGGTYALVSNMLANAGRWVDSNTVREQMRSNSIRKMAGCSWIVVRGSGISSSLGQTAEINTA